MRPSFFDVDVDELAWLLTFVADHWPKPQSAEPPHAQARQDWNSPGFVDT
jgi:hypothetical protein